MTQFSPCSSPVQILLPSDHRLLNLHHYIKCQSLDFPVLPATDRADAANKHSTLLRHPGWAAEYKHVR